MGLNHVVKIENLFQILIPVLANGSFFSKKIFWLNVNCGPWFVEAFALPVVPQPLSNQHCFNHSDIFVTCKLVIGVIN